MTPSFKPKRIPGNTNLRYWHESTYDGYPLMLDKGPFIEQYLEKLYQTLQYALSDYARVFAFRFDLRLPCGKPLPDDAMTNQVIQRFKASLDAQISHDRERARMRSRSSHDTCARLFWVREVGKGGRPHYHCIGFLNRDAYCSLGYIKSTSKNMYNRLTLAWASALRLPVDDVLGAVHVTKDATHHLARHDYLGHDEFFRRSSYLCKSATKVFGDGQHGCGGSRC
ncbi:inovirus Gp2 family protein [Pseudomonas fluorescens]|uniref:YagK/YfjJ domain-containing protein n=2 Tax=Pseudomonas TaxID=286 RepID=UPI000CF646E5|nr:MULTISPECIES: inovirus-type Gp2 protein [Pseudomonas]MQT56247.1 inovirus Gp2 family protein [Pseudomonas sp. FSL R10-0399]AVJ39607.1 transposase [Pseudomonas lurida]MBD8193358.1 inovirus Gp2 family protein [Pseudomonas fluorescens]MBD8228554.1 inovirus Gp2 family protein [Pseudomonas fluorescens]MBD8743459.1 inovirus Gp2 family protein [Pseudomonas fluorescens]